MQAKILAAAALFWGVVLAALLAAAVPAFAEPDRYPPPPEDWPEPIQDSPLVGLLLFHQLEHRINDGPDAFRWEVEGWLGGDYNRFWFKTEGEQRLSGEEGGEAEVQALYSRLIAPFWDFQVGLRYDKLLGPGPNPSRVFAVIGLQGLAPYWFEVEPVLFISEDGDASARLTATYELLLTQRVIAQPRFEVNAAAQEVEEFGVGKGVNDFELGLRLRYEIRREFAPYIGVSWERKLGSAADIARRGGEGTDNLMFLAGIRLWF